MFRQCSSGFRERAVRLVSDRFREDSQVVEYQVIKGIASMLGIFPGDFLALAPRRGGIETGLASVSESVELCRLRRESAELRWVDELLKAVLAFSHPNSTAPRRNDHDY